MKLFLKIFVVLTMIFFLHAGTGYADTVLLRNGDKLIGEIQNEYIVVRGSYSQIVVQKAYCKNIIMDPRQILFVTLKTINNDIISGTIMNPKIQILLPNETRETVNSYDLKSVFFEISGPSRQVSTTIFTMSDRDRYSGELLNPEIKVQTEYKTATYKGAEINRIDFAVDNPDKVKLMLINGDIIQGKFLLDEIIIEPDSFAQLTADKSKFSSIQFNARKLLLKEYSSSTPSEQDIDRDGVPDIADKCSGTPWGDPVNEKGCSKGKIVAKTVITPEIKSEKLQDEDGDGVSDYSDKCPQTPLGAKVDKGGCWSTPDILFDFDSYLVKRSYYPVLDKVFAVLKMNPTIKIKVQGSSDNIGSSEYNQILSEKRARAVKNYLVAKGIEPERLSAVGHGSTRKAASNKTAAGRALNRRIDFMVID